MSKIILLKAIVGSKAYGTDTPQSNVDIKGVYLQDPLSVLSFDYLPQINENKDTQYLEVRRFLELLQSSNPTMLELLFIPEDCILEKDPYGIWDSILEHKQTFITKGCMNSFMGYAKQQIYKAQGLDKKMNWEKDRIERKRPIDFMKVINKEQAYPLIDYLNKTKKLENCCGLVKINNTQGLYYLYYDYIKEIGQNTDLSNPRYKNYKPHGYKGICNDSQLLVSEIPLGQINNGEQTIQYNLNGFEEHCKDYNFYQIWLKERNASRYIDIKNHNQMIGGKNMLHGYRLLEMAKEIALTGEFHVRRPNAQKLLKIRKGEFPLQKLLDEAKDLVKEVEILFANSSLPNTIDKDLINSLLKQIRKQSLKISYD